MNIDEKELFIRISGGDERAFHQLFHLYNKQLLPFIFKLTQSMPAAEEIVQEVFIKIWNKREKLAEIDVPKAWITRIVSNHCYNYLRKEAVEGRLFKVLRERAESRSLSPEEYVAAKEAASMIKKGIDKLPAQLRQVYLLNKEEGLSVQEIAERLNVSPNTVRNQLVTATKKLRNHLKSNLYSIVLLLL